MTGFDCEDDQVREWAVDLPNLSAALRHAQRLGASDAALARVTVRDGFAHVAHVPGAGMLRSVTATDGVVERTHRLIHASRDLLARTRAQ